MNEIDREVVIVSGLPRSGTSMMMQALKAGGMDVLTDGEREADESNPLGYFEIEAIKKLPRGDASGLADAPGKAVKIIHALLRFLPPSNRYKIIFMMRNLEEVVASQRKMLERQGRPGAALEDAQLIEVFAKQRADSLRWVESQTHLELLQVEYARCIREPGLAVGEVTAFLDKDLDRDAMARSIRPDLYRQKQGD